MKLMVKLFAGLGEYLPADAKNNITFIEIDADESVFDVIASFGIPPEKIHLVLLNGVYLQAGQRTDAIFNEGDVLAIWPPVAGG